MATDNKDFKVKNGLVVANGGSFGGTVSVATPTANDHATTKLYVDSLFGGGGGSFVGFQSHTASYWSSNSTIVLGLGVLGWESDTNKFKLGDGSNQWADLSYFVDIDSINTSLGDYILAATLGQPNGTAELDSNAKLKSAQIPDLSSTNISDFNEAAQDAIGNSLGSGLSYNDSTGAISVDTTIVQARVANVSDTEIGYLDGVTSGIQEQINSKLNSSTAASTYAPINSPTFTGTVTLPEGTVTSAMIADGSIVNSDISSTAAIALSKLATDPLNRTNHTGTQLASTISDFDTQVRTSKVTDLSAPTSSFSMNSQKITNLANPTSPQDAATMAYVDAATAGLNVHASVRVATTGDINLSNALENGDTVDGIVLVTGNRVLVKNQNTAADNGIYVVQSSGPAVRATDYDSVPEVDAGDFIFVESGTANGKTGWVQTNTITTLGSDPIAFTQFSGAGTYTAGNGLTLTGNSFSINTAITADLNTAQTLTNKTLTSPTITGTGSIAGTFTGNLTGNVTGNVSGNAGTVTNGIYTTDVGTVTSAMIANGTIVDADISASAAIAISKLAASSVTINGTSVTLGNSATITAVNPNALTIGTGLSGTTYNGSSAVTIAIDSTVATLTGTQTLTNKTLTDSTTFFQDELDNTKKMQFQLSGITASNTRTLTVPDASGTIALTSNKLSSFASTTSSELASIISDETGTGSLVFSASPTFTGTVVLPSDTSIGLVSSTEIGYLDGVTSSIQSQLDSKLASATAASTYAPLASPTFTGTLNAATILTTGNVTVGGDLVVNGTTTTLNTNTLTVDDKNIELGSVVAATISTTGTIGSVSGTGPFTATITGMTSTSGLIPGQTITATAGTGNFGSGTMTVSSIVSSTSITVSSTATFSAGTVTNILGQAANDSTANGGGITLKGTTDKTITWDSTSTNWTSSEHINVLTGKVYKIANTQVLSSTSVLGLTPTINAIGYTLSGGTTPVAVTFAGGAAYTISGTNGQTYTLPSSSGTLITGSSPSISNLTLTGTLTAGGSTGTTGQVLQSTGTGVQWASASGGGGATVSSTAPSSPSQGQFWFNTSIPALLIYDGSFWVRIT